MSNNIIPFLPKSIAVGLHDDLLQFETEIKFLLLFFNKPLAIMFNAGLNFLPSDAIDLARKGIKIRTNIFEDSVSLQNLELIQTEEWEELINCCETHYSELFLSNKNVVDNANENLINSVDGIFYKENPKIDGISFHLLERVIQRLDFESENVKSVETLLGNYFSRIELQRLISILEICRDRKIPMIWGNETTLSLTERYSKALAEEYVKEQELGEESKSILRMLKGDNLLKDILDLDIISLATVPVHKIIKFRKSNSDLLDNFLRNYRLFLEEVQNEPLQVEAITGKHRKVIETDLDKLNEELKLLRENRFFSVLKKSASPFYDAANKGAVVATFGLFMNNLLLALPVFADALFKASSNVISEVSDAKQKERELLFRSSSGYLWKAKERFKVK